MNWKKIEKDHPKSWEAMCKHGVLDEEDWVEDGAWTFVYNLRNLYDFFDDNELYVAVHTLLMAHTTDNTRFFGWDIDTMSDSLMDHEYYDIRTEAEEAAFTVAFKLLEQKL